MKFKINSAGQHRLRPFVQPQRKRHGLDDPRLSQSNRFRCLLPRRQKSLRGRQEFNGRQLRCNHPEALQTSLGSSAGLERQEVLVAEVRGEFIKIGLEGDGRAGAKIIGFGARFIRELAKIRLRPESEEESARP